MTYFVYRLIHFFNYHSLLLIIVGAAIFFAVWGWIEYRLYRHKTAYRTVNFVLLAITMCVILSYTVWFRTESVHSVSLIPFRLLYYSFTDQVIFKSLVMNVLLFIPVSLFGCSAFRCTSKKSAVVTILLGALFSVSIEALQHLFSVGQADIDDVICNTLGAAAGYGIYRAHFRRFLEHEPHLSKESIER